MTRFDRGLHVAILAAVAVALIAIHRLHRKLDRSGFFATPGIGNFEMAGNRPLWWFGGMDAGSGGSLARDVTPQQASVFIPRLRRSNQWRANRLAEARGEEPPYIGI